MIKTYDSAVVGAGVFGAWIALRLSERGQRVALVDAYGPGNGRSSSGGETRIVRMGYGEEEFYTRWAQRSFEAWERLSADAGRPLFARTGVLFLGRENDAQMRATCETLARVGLPVEALAASELRARFPQMRIDDGDWALLEPEAGALLARRAVQEAARTVQALGGDVLRAAVEAPTGAGRLTRLRTCGPEKGEEPKEIEAGAFVFACGAWLPGLFPELLRDRIQPTRQEVFFFGLPPGDGRFASPALPTWIDFDAGFYGLPDLESRGFKIGLDEHGPALDPDAEERQVFPETLARIRAFMAHRFPAMANAPLLETRVCQYENTHNGDFLIDRHPDFENVWLAGGGSGHGFKHGPALGEYVARQILDRAEPEPRFLLASKQTVRRRAIF